MHHGLLNGISLPTRACFSAWKMFGCASPPRSNCMLINKYFQVMLLLQCFPDEVNKTCLLNAAVADEHVKCFLLLHFLYKPQNYF